MKAIIEIELEIDGEWRPEDKNRLVKMILDNPVSRVWEIEDERLAVFANSMTVELKGE